MKHRLWTSSVSVLFLAASLLAGCALPLGPAASSPAGTLTVQAGSLGTRTILPDLGVMTYDLTMELRDADSNLVDSFQEPGDSDGLFPLRNLAMGSWTATVEVRSDGTLVASGTVTRTVTADSSPTLVVPVSWVFTGTTTAPVFTIDASASPYPVLAATAYWDGVKTNNAINLNDKRISFNFGAQSQGIHQLRIVFYRDIQKTLPVGTFDQGVVYLATVGVPNIVLTAADFNPVGRPEMVEIPGGSFTFGTATATVSPFLIGKYPVTQAQFQAVMGFNPSDYDNSNTSSRANPEATWSPVESVSWYDAVEFANRLSNAQGFQPVYRLSTVVRSGNHITSATVTTDLSRNGYRLPTEAEYEYATRAGTTTDYFWGGADGADYSWGTYNTGSPLTRTYGVGQKSPNAWGLYDMVGNVWSWLNDYSDAQPTAATLDYAGPASGTERLFRGGSFLSSSGTTPTLNDAFLSGFRGLDDPPQTTMSDVGFRVVRRLQLEAGNSTTALFGSVPEATLDSGYGRFLHIEADHRHPGKFLVSGVSGMLDNTGLTPWGTNLMARFNADASLDSTFGNNTDAALHAAQVPYGPTAMFSPFGQTSVIQTQYGHNGTTGESFYSGFAQTNFGLYAFHPSVAGGWWHTEVTRHDANGVLDVGYSQPVYTPGTQYFLPFVVYANFGALAPTLVDDAGMLYTAGYDNYTGGMAVVRMGANGAFPWQNDSTNWLNRYYQSTFPIADFRPARMALQPDNKLLIVGNDVSGVNGRLLRLDVSGSSGSLDTSFATGGYFSFHNGNADGSQRHYSDVKYYGGKIYVTGWDYLNLASPQVTGFVIRLNLDGTLDTTFAPGGNNGILNTPETPRYALPPPFTRPQGLDVGVLGANELIAVVGSTESLPQAFVALVTKDGVARGAETLLSDASSGSGALSVAIGDTHIGIAGFTNKPGGTEGYHTLPAFWRF